MKTSNEIDAILTKHDVRHEVVTDEIVNVNVIGEYNDYSLEVYPDTARLEAFKAQYPDKVAPPQQWFAYAPGDDSGPFQRDFYRKTSEGVRQAVNQLRAQAARLDRLADALEEIER